MAEATKHDAAIAGAGSGEKWQAICLCGWVGERGRTKVEAQQEAWTHDVESLRAERAALSEQVKELEATRCQEDHLHPDWSMLEATRRSLRGSWAREKKLRELLDRALYNLEMEGCDPAETRQELQAMGDCEEPPDAARHVLVEIANHLSMRLAWGVDPGTVDVKWICDAIDARSERTHARCIIAAGTKDSEAALAVEDVDPLAP